MNIKAARGQSALLHPVLLRFRDVAPHAPELLEHVGRMLNHSTAVNRVQPHPAKTVLQRQNDPVRRPRYLLSGWACRHRELPDGRRQIFDLVLPGEGVGVCLGRNPIANTDTTALNSVQLVDASPLLALQCLDATPDLRATLQAFAEADERRALNQIMRLGRLTALERLVHLFLEIRERLQVIEEVQGDRFPLPLTQETLADLTGLSVVHVNRTLQELRRRDLALVERGTVRIPNLAQLIEIAAYE